MRVCVAGVTGWTGSSVAKAVHASSDLTLEGAVARKSAGKALGEVLGVEGSNTFVQADLNAIADADVDVFVDYTSASSVKANVLAALNKGWHVVVGSSGLSQADFDEIEKVAKAKNLGVIACGNFSITAALAKHFSLIAARYLPNREIIDYASAKKIDVPSGTTRELAEQLAAVKANEIMVPIDTLHGPKEARGAQIGGTPVHSVRLSSYTIAFETIFGMPDERLTIRHDAGAGAEPYVAGTLLAIRKVAVVKGLLRGMDTLLFQE